MASRAGVSVERLESRVLMAATVTLSRRGRLLITSDDAPDLVEITLANGRRNVQVFVNNAIVDPRAHLPLLGTGKTDYPSVEKS